MFCVVPLGPGLCSGLGPDLGPGLCPGLGPGLGPGLCSGLGPVIPRTRTTYRKDKCGFQTFGDSNFRAAGGEIWLIYVLYFGGILFELFYFER